MSNKKSHFIKRTCLVLSIFLIAISSSVYSSMENSNSSNIIKGSSVTLKLPNNWQDLTHSEWLRTLKLSEKCSVNQDIKHARFTQFLKLNDENSLLVVACELGAYQDSHLLFYLSAKQPTVTAKEIRLNELFFEYGWKEKLADKITGYISIDKNRLVVTRRYVGAWTCGYVATYDIDGLDDGEALKLINAKADNNCDNGVKRDKWPMVKIIK